MVQLTNMFAREDANPKGCAANTSGAGLDEDHRVAARAQMDASSFDQCSTAWERIRFEGMAQPLLGVCYSPIGSLLNFPHPACILASAIPRSDDVVRGGFDRKVRPSQPE